MKEITAILKRINSELDLPQPTKSRIILEISADMEDTYRLYLERGLSKKEAIQNVIEKFDLTEDSLKDLVEVHQSYFGRLFDRISAQAQTRWERVVLIVMLIFVILFCTQNISIVNFIRQTSNFIWLPMGLGFASLILAMTKFYSIFIKKKYNLKTVRTKLPLLFFLSSGTLVTSVFGYIAEMYLAGPYSIFMHYYLMIIIKTNVQQPFFSLEYLTDWMMKSSSLVMFGIVSFMILITLWYILINQVIKIEQKETEFLFN